MQQEQARRDNNECGAATPQRQSGGHGASAFQRTMSFGAFAAIDQLAPDDGQGSSARPRWSPEFAVIVDAYQAEQRGNREQVKELLCSIGIELRSDEANVGDAVAEILGRGENVDSDRFQELFGWLDDRRGRPPVDDKTGATGTKSSQRAVEVGGRAEPAFVLYVGLSDVFRVIWILKILCCALAWRRNDFGRYVDPDNPQTLTDAEIGALSTQLEALSLQMNEGFENAAGDGHVPLGFVFFAQFVDHDLTFDATSHLDEVANPAEIDNLRSPSFDLDNVYADGPEGSPHLYDQDPDRGFGFLLTAPDGRDLVRNHQGRAVIGDPRNDENTLVSQFHLHVLHAHNALLRMIRNTNVDALWGRDLTAEPVGSDLGDFEFARRMLRWHYQWATVNDWLPRIIDPTVLEAAHAIAGVPQGSGVPALPAGYDDARDFFDSLNLIDSCGNKVCRPLMPVEFSAAAFRFAHSQVRSRYDLNQDRLDVPLFAPLPPALASFDSVAPSDLVDWNRFFEIEPTVTPQPARQIDTWLSAQVFQLPFAPDAPNLALRNLLRGVITFRLPTAGAVAAELGVPLNLSSTAITKLANAGIAPAQAPLWFAILGEAEDNGGRLGPIGGLLVATSLFRMLDCDEASYVHAPGWEPVLIPSASPPEFTVADLVRIGVNERNDAFPSGS